MLETILAGGQDVIRNGWADGDVPSPGMMAAHSLTPAGRSRLTELETMKPHETFAKDHQPDPDVSSR